MSTPAAIDLLKKSADVPRYRAAANAPAWIKAMSELALSNVGALSLIGPPGLSIDCGDFKERVVFEQAAVYLASLVDCASKRHLKVAIAYPPVGSHVPLLLAIGSVLATGIGRHLSSGEEPARPVLVISPDLELRSRYCGVYVKDVRLDAAYPGSRLLTTGAREPLTKTNEAGSDGGVCFFLPNLNLPPSIGFQPHTVILDLRFARWQGRLDALLSWVDALKVPVVSVHTFGDMECEYAVARYNFHKFYLDHSSLAAFLPPPAKLGSEVDWGLTRAATFLKRKHSIIEIPDCETVEKLFVNCSSMLDQAQKADPSDLNRAFWILATLRHLPVPLNWYESVAREQGRSTIRRLISQVGYRSSNVESVGPLLQTIRMTLDSLYQQLDRNNPKAEFLKEFLPSRCSVSKLMCITRDAISQKALRSWIDAEFQSSTNTRVESVAVTNFRNVERSESNETLVIGPLPRRYRWIVGAQLSPKVSFVTYPHESDAVERQLSVFYALSATKQCAVDRLNTLSKLTGRTLSTNDGTSNGSNLELERPSRSQPKQPLKATGTSHSLQDLSSMLRRAEAKAVSQIQETEKNAKWEDRFDEEPPEDVDSALEPTSVVDAVACYRVQVNLRSRGLGVLILAKDLEVECIRPNAPDEIAKVLPVRLVAGDVLPRVDDRGRTTLFETIISLVDEQPSMRTAASMRRQWQAAIKYVNERYRKRFSPYSTQVEYRTLLEDLWKHGATVSTEQAVRGWLEGTTIGPDSIGSIQAIGKLSMMESIVIDAKEFDKAFRKFRSLHQGIGRRLAAAVRSSFRKFADASTDQQPTSLDLSLAVPIAELLDSMDFAEVMSLSKVPELLSPSQVGRFFKT